MTPNKSCKEDGDVGTQGRLAWGERAVEVEYKELLDDVPPGWLLDEASASTNLHRPCTTLNESKIHESWTSRTHRARAMGEHSGLIG